MEQTGCSVTLIRNAITIIIVITIVGETIFILVRLAIVWNAVDVAVFLTTIRRCRHRRNQARSHQKSHCCCSISSFDTHQEPCLDRSLKKTTRQQISYGSVTKRDIVPPLIIAQSDFVIRDPFVGIDAIWPTQRP